MVENILAIVFGVIIVVCGIVFLVRESKRERKINPLTV